MPAGWRSPCALFASTGLSLQEGPWHPHLPLLVTTHQRAEELQILHAKQMKAQPLQGAKSAAHPRAGHGPPESSKLSVNLLAMVGTT